MIQLKKLSRKTISLFFILIMFSSTLAYSLLSAFIPKEELKIPKERILNYELNTAQKSFLLRRGFTLIEYYYPPNCLNCTQIRDRLEEMTRTSNNQIFLQELNGESHKVVITSFRGQKTLYDPDVKTLETTVCDLLAETPIWCVTSKI